MDGYNEHRGEKNELMVIMNGGEKKNAATDFGACHREHMEKFPPHLSKVFHILYFLFILRLELNIFHKYIIVKHSIIY